MRSIAAVTMWFLCTANASADVIVVDKAGPPGTFKTIQVAVNNADPGDTILVKGSGDVPFGENVVISGMSLTLLADVGVAPHIRSLVIRDLPAGAAVVVRGLQVDSLPGAPDLIRVTIEDCAGAVRLESLMAQGIHGSAGIVPFQFPFGGVSGMHVTACLDLAARDCTITGGAGADLLDEDSQYSPTSAADGVVVTSGNVALYDCTVRGLDGGSVFDTVTDSGGSGGSGLRNIGGRVFMSGGSALGGKGGSGDCDIFLGFCGGGGAGGSGVRQELLSAALYLRDVMTAGGAGGFGGSLFGPAQQAKSGHPVTVNAGTFTAFGALKRSFNAGSPAREGAQLALVFTGEAGDAALVLAGLQLGQVISQKLQGALLVTGHYATASPIVAGSIAVSGSPLVTMITVPDLPDGLQEATFHLQSLFKPANGPMVIGPASTTTVLDASY